MLEEAGDVGMAFLPRLLLTGGWVVAFLSLFPHRERRGKKS
jgi:hypothetical protein